MSGEIRGSWDNIISYMLGRGPAAHAAMGQQVNTNSFGENDGVQNRSNAMNQFHQAVREWEAARNSRDLIRMPIGIPPTYETDINAYTDEELRQVFLALRVPLVCRFKSVKNQLLVVRAMRDMGFMVEPDFIKLRATWMRHTVDAELDRVKIRE